MPQRIMDIEQEIRAIQERNAKVTLDKKWEVSFVRRGFILGITYVCAFALLKVIHASDPALGALVPCAGYILSTLSLPFIRKHWEK